MESIVFPPGVQVLVRDWLNANGVLLRGDTGNMLIDTGYGSHARATLDLVRAALSGEPLDGIVNTHSHSDHLGGNAALARAYRCPITVPAGEAETLRAWDTRALWLDYADQHAERFAFDRVLAPGDELRLGNLSWQAIAAPGHAMGALMLYSPEARILVTGDALWEFGFGVVAPEPGCLEAARATLERIAALDVDIVIPGHGKPFRGTGAALEHCFRRVDALAKSEIRMANSVLKAMLAFTLLDRGRLPLPSLPTYLGAVPIYREYNERFFKVGYDELAESLVADLERAGAAVRRAGWLVKPTA